MVSKKESAAALAAMVEQARTHAGKFSERMGPVVVDARDRLGPVVEDARDRLVPIVEEARDRLGPIVEEARDRLAELADQANARMDEVLADRDAAASGAAVDMSGPTAAGSDSSAGTAGESGGGGAIRKVLMVLGLGAAAGAVARRATGAGADTSEPRWRPASVPTTDAAGGTPEEAVSDATDIPHSSTTPDDPTERIILD